LRWRRCGGFYFAGEAGVETIAEAGGKLEDAVVRGEDEDVSRGIEDGGTDLAVLEMPLDQFFGRWVQRIIQVVGDVVPDVFAFYDH
jgi:hypothetical protein